MKPLILIGSAACLGDDLKAIGPIDADYMALNETGARFPSVIQWWATYHPRKMHQMGWLRTRSEMGGNMDFTVIMHERNVEMERAHPACTVIEGPRLTGSVALFGTLFALIEAGYDEVVLAGCPLTGPYAYFRPGWDVYAEHLAGRVRSMSGWTKDFLEGLY